MNRETQPSASRAPESLPGRLRVLLQGPRRAQWRVYAVVVVAALVAIIGLLDYYAGYETFCFVFYVLPISIAVVTLGRWPAVGVAFVSLGVAVAGDLAGGAHFHNPLTLWWNSAIVFLTYLILIWLLETLLISNTKLRVIHLELEDRVRQRTAALNEQIAERERLENAVLEIGRRERLSIGQDLHDGLGQYLLGTALAGKILAQKLQTRQAEEAADAQKVVGFIEEAIEQTRSLAKGLFLPDIDRHGLTTGLEELAKTTEAQHRIECAFRSRGEVDLREHGVATHLYCIAQEAVRNAVRHGRAQAVEINLFVEEDGLILSVSDDGIGLPGPEARGQGLGLRIMAHRAAIIGADFTIDTPPEGGTLVRCRQPRLISTS
jgi:signal transduction histidine kinase